MDVKRYMFMGVDFIKERESPDGNIVFYEDIKHYIPRPDPAEVEKAIDKFEAAVNKYFFAKLGQRPEAAQKVDKARTDLLKLVGG